MLSERAIVEGGWKCRIEVNPLNEASGSYFVMTQDQKFVLSTRHSSWQAHTLDSLLVEIILTQQVK